LDEGLDPQTCLDRARFRVDGEAVLLEPGLWHAAEALDAAGQRVVKSADLSIFGAGQMIERRDGALLLGGSDSRMDGYVGVVKS
ncbi:MAG: hypothetical protein ACRDSN_23240, partial [Pseudonocardiaceae bacterium]